MDNILKHRPSQMRSIVCLVAVFFFLFQPTIWAAAAETPPEPAGSTGWVEISAAVPADFTAPLVISLLNNETQEEYDFPVIAENDYITLEELPVGSYSFSAGFVEGGDFRYSLIPVETEYLVAYNEVAAAVKIDVIFNEEYADGVSLPDSYEEESAEPTEETDKEDVGETTTEKVPSEEKEPVTFSTVLKRIGIALAGALAFTGIVFLSVFLVRKFS